jgi:hypothetical protein
MTSHFSFIPNPEYTPQTEMEDFVFRHPEKPWHFGYNGLSINPGITTDFVEAHPSMRWHWGSHGLSMNPNVSPEYIISHPEHQWEFGSYGIYLNPSITPKYLHDHSDSIITKKCNWGGEGSYAMNPSLQFKDIEQYLSTEQTNFLFNNLNLALTYFATETLIRERFLPEYRSDIPVYSRIECYWNQYGLSANSNISLEFINDMIQGNLGQFEWGKNGLSINPIITMEYILEDLQKPIHLQKHWCWEEDGVSMNPHLNDYILQNPEYTSICSKLHWGQDGVSCNPSVSLTFIEEHPEIDWEWGYGGISCRYSPYHLRNSYDTFQTYCTSKKSILEWSLCS